VSAQDERDELLEQLLAHGRFLASLDSIGVAPPAPLVSKLQSHAAAEGTGTVTNAAPDAERAEQGDPAARLAAVRETIGDCRRCALAAGRKTIVFGQGNPQAELMFVGEAPGAEEDEQGLAFVGRAGQLLTDIIEKGLRMARKDVFIANVIKCRPPQNRNPEPAEILACQPFLEAQIRGIRPRVLVGLGKFGAHWLLKTAEPITRLRGRVGEYQGIPVMPTYHPAYLLRNPSAKKDVWADMKEVLRMLGRSIPG
jgi:uracil-DNA glycosylase family 4